MPPTGGQCDEHQRGVEASGERKAFDASASVLDTADARTADLGGTATSREFTELVTQAIARP